MNKKFITLCVSALLAGGMVAPSYASILDKTAPVAYSTYTAWENAAKSHFFFEIKVRGGDGNAFAVADTDYNLKATFNSYGITETQSEISGYSLWQFVQEKDANGNLLGYRIVNAYGIPLAAKENTDGTFTLDREGSIVLFEYSNQQIKVVGKDAYLCWDINASNAEKVVIKAGSDIDKITNFDNLCACVYEPALFANDAKALSSVFGDHFGLQIGYLDTNDNNVYKQYENLQGNVFTGKLYPANNDDLKSSSVTIYNLTATGREKETFLKNEAGEFIVLLKDKWNQINTDLNGDDLKGYRFSTMTAKELGEDLAKPANQQTVQSYVFRIAGVNGHVPDVDAPLEVAVKVNMDKNSTGDEEAWAELLVAGINNAGDVTYYLTTAQAANDNKSTYAPLSKVAGDLDLNVADYIPSTYVKFGMNNYVSPTVFWGAAWNIERQDNKTPNPQSGEWVDKREVGYTVPEGQWILREEAVPGATYGARVQTWVNRETGETLAGKFDFEGLRTTDEANVYTDGTYTYKITKAVDLADADRFDYFGYDAKETSTGVEETYKVVFDSELTGEPVYISMDGVGELHLTNDPTKAIEFHVDTIKTTDDAAVVNDLGLNANPDIFDIVNKYMGKDKDGNWVEKEDTVSFYRYTLSHDGKYLHYSATDNKFVLNEPVYNDGKGGAVGSVDDQKKSHLMYRETGHEVDAFVIKEKGGDLVNIINVNNDDFDKYSIQSNYSHLKATYADGSNYINGTKLIGSGSTAAMMYFDFNFDEARQQQNIYNWVSNAQLQLDYQDYDIYRNVAPTAPDTMAIYRTEYQDEFLFEKNGFLGMTVDDRGYNAALFIDTAYVRNNTEKPLFMIGLRPEITPETVYCPIHGVDAGCAHEHLDTIPGYVDADYLTVLADSSAFHAAELDNKFLANKAYTKLSFVAARHNVDTITVATDGNKTTISQNVQHPMVFAFRIVDQSTKDFIIEGVDLTNNKAPLSAGNPYKTSWMRWNNGVPVMTDIMEDAEVFNIAGDLENANPTANEAIEAEATVSVVATDGAVIVKGAEGKNVIVSTILGKVVANETVNSDNETIAAPAGIVVVSVDGESFKVAVK